MLAGIDPAPFVGDAADLEALNQILLERFLINVDDGWIFRGARSYRGALQIEDEEAGARALVLAMLADREWLAAERFARLREAIRLLPLPRGDEASAARVRHLALVLADKDKPFTPLRAKIHNVPDAGDAEKVREYARSRAPAGMRKEYERLAAEIDELYRTGAAAETLKAAGGAVSEPRLAEDLRKRAAALAAASKPAQQLRAVSSALEMLRDALATAGSPQERLVLLEASLALEDDAYTTGTALLAGLDRASRQERLAWLGDAATALYGVGFISRRHLNGVRESLARIDANPKLDVDTYRSELRYLARAPEWSGRWLEFNFGETVAPLARDRAPLPPLHAGPPARQPAALLQHGDRQPLARRQPAGGHRARALRPEGGRRSARAQPGPGAGRHGGAEARGSCPKGASAARASTCCRSRSRTCRGSPASSRAAREARSPTSSCSPATSASPTSWSARSTCRRCSSATARTWCSR